MNRRLLLMTLALLTGCQTMPVQPGFDEVQSQVEARGGHRVVWRTGAEEDRAADEAVRSLLAGELTAARAQQIALLNNRRLQAEYESLGIAQASVVQAGLLKNPVFEMAVLFPSGGGSAMLDIGVAQDFLDVLYIPLRTRIAQADYEAVKTDLTAKVLTTAHDTQLAWLQVQADAQTLAQLQTNLKTAEASFEFARRMHQAGNLRQVDLVNEEATLAQVRIEVADASTALAVSRERLTSLMGLWGDDVTSWRLTEQQPEMPTSVDEPTDLERNVIVANLELKAMQHRLSARAEEAGLARSTAWLAEMELGAAGERDDGHWEAGPTLSLPVPLFDQGQARVATAVARLRRDQQLLYARAVEIRSIARQAHMHYAAAHQKAMRYRHEILPLRERIMKETMLQYNAMQVSVFQLLSVRAQQADAHRRAIAAEHECWKAKARLDLLLAGVALEGDAAVREQPSQQTTEAQGH